MQSIIFLAILSANKVTALNRGDGSGSRTANCNSVLMVASSRSAHKLPHNVELHGRGAISFTESRHHMDCQLVLDVDTKCPIICGKDVAAATVGAHISVPLDLSTAWGSLSYATIIYCIFFF